MEYSFFGKKLDNPTTAQKAFIWSAVIAALGTAVVFSPVLIPAHIALRKSGREGFYHEGSIQFTAQAFARRDTDWRNHE